MPKRVPDDTGAELKRGALVNTLAMLASNFRGIFTFLVARLLGPAALGTFSVAWANTDLVSKIAVFGLDNTVTTFIARAQAVGDWARSRTLFRLAVALAVGLSATIALVSVVLGLLLSLSPIRGLISLAFRLALFTLKPALLILGSLKLYEFITKCAPRARHLKASRSTGSRLRMPPKSKLRCTTIFNL